MDLQDPTLWVAVSFVILIAGVFKPAKRAVLGMLDNRVEAIRRELDEAAALREEAQQLLADYQRKQRAAVQEAETVVARAQASAERLLADGEEKLVEALRRREQAATEKIAQAEAEAVRAIHAQAVDIAVEATRRMIRARMDDEKSSALINRSMAELRDTLH